MYVCECTRGLPCLSSVRGDVLNSAEIGCSREWGCKGGMRWGWVGEGGRGGGTVVEEKGGGFGWGVCGEETRKGDNT